MKVIVIISCLFMLSGCAGMNGRFDCDVKSGGACLAMDQINKLTDQGAFNEDGKRAGKTRDINLASITSTGYPLFTYRGQPIRYGETIQQIWIAPYEDSIGNYHEPSYVYTVIKGGHWLGDPVQEIIN